jgi:hypothetical protein
MATKKRSGKAGSKKRAPRRKPAPRAKGKRARKTAARKPPRRKAASRKAPTRKAPTSKRATKKTARRRPPKPKAKKQPKAQKRPLVTRHSRGRADSDVDLPERTRGLGAEAGGQSGDTEGISRDEIADSESVEELLEEGQAFEAGVISGVENAPDADRGGVRTRQVPEDDVPEEYLDKD